MRKVYKKVRYITIPKNIKVGTLGFRYFKFHVMFTISLSLYIYIYIYTKLSAQAECNTKSIKTEVNRFELVFLLLDWLLYLG